MAAMKILLSIVLLALVASTSAHKHEKRSMGVRAKRADPVNPASSCSFMTCAVSGGSCGVISPGHTQLCVAGEHCSGTTCVADLQLGAACKVNALENECAQGRCVDTGSGPTCQIIQEILPGNPCTTNFECYPSTLAGTSSCVNNVCVGRNNGDLCTANYQCSMGSYCASNGQCAALGAAGATCSVNSDCNSRLSCLNSKCTAHYSQAAGQSCSATINCAPGLYCNKDSKVCTATASGSRTTQKCDIASTSSTNCPANMECSCDGFTSSSQSATCAPIKGTYADMPSIEKSAFSCIDQYSCGSDFSNNKTISCISQNCLASYCTYFTRTAAELFTDYPSCLLNGMTDTPQYASFLASCKQYAPSAPATTSSASVLGASLAWVGLIAAALFFFEL